MLTRRGESRSALQKIIWMIVCRDLENLEDIGSDRKSVLRARRTRRPKMATIQNSNRYDQNVDKALHSRKIGLKNYKRLFWAQISLISLFLIFWTQGGPPIGPLFGRRAFFSQTLVLTLFTNGGCNAFRGKYKKEHLGKCLGFMLH